ncbi:flagellin N-terminal helical domain-containing protein [Vibrio parahaemolyticus]|uniref:flagellin N-terminal helical domain-containing protein n=1 Tax=Vibrio parahaemolyticus TaxID=670 RepID=UPI0004702C98|nr:flagellin [Vibrio parahaemolyticus]MDF4748874.1 flagellin [Vibrio parahaemolyticus]
MTSISSIKTNAPAMQYQSQLNRSIDKQNTSMERLSSGVKINTAKDDAAGFQISNRLQVQSRGMDVAIRNANDGISMLQTAEGALGEYTENLMQMRDLTLRYANGSLSENDRKAISSEFSALRDELNRITQTTDYGGISLLNSQNSTRSFQIGSSSGEAIQVNLTNTSIFTDDKNETSEQHLVRWRKLNRNFNADTWRAKEGDVIQIAFVFDAAAENPNGKNEYFKFHLEPGSSFQDFIDMANDELAGRLTMFLQHEKDETIAGRGNRYVLSSYTSDGSRIIAHQLGTSIYDPHSIFDSIGASDDTGRYHANAENSNTNIIPELDGNVDIVFEKLDNALRSVDSGRAYLGATLNRFHHAISNLSQSSENVADSHSQIRDTDFAKESTQLTKQSILKEVNTSMLAQAGNAPQSALNLLS